MAGFCRNFFALTTLRSPTTGVIFNAAQKAVELAMLGQIDEASAIFAILAQHHRSETVEERDNRPFNQRIPRNTPFLYEIFETLPPGVGEVDRLNDEEELQRLEEHFLHEIRPSFGPEAAIDISRHATEADFEKLNSLVKKTLASGDSYLNATTGASALYLSRDLAGLLSISLYLNKTAEADDIMARIADRIHANQQAEYLSCIRPVWKKYFKSGWLRDKLGLSEDELKQYAEFILNVTKKRLEEGPVTPSDEYKDKSFQEMLEELNQNTLRFPEMWEDRVPERGDGDESTVPSTILREPATADEIARVESRLGCSLPDDLKDFYSLTNGTRAVISGPHFYTLNNSLLRVQELFWEDASWMVGYEFDLFPETTLPVQIKWPNIDGGAIAMYEPDGQGTIYMWYFQGELLAKAKEVLDEAYQKAGESDKKIIDKLVERYHGSWDQLRDLQSCWYQQGWGSGPIALFHNFRDFFSLVVFESQYEEDKSPVKLPEGEL